MRRVSRRQHKCSFGQVQLLRDPLHDAWQQVWRRLREDCQRIAAELPIGEYVKQVIFQAHGIAPSAVCAEVLYHSLNGERQAAICNWGA